MTTKKRRISEALSVLKDLGMPSEQFNDRSAISLLALLDLDPSKKWQDAKNPMLGIRAILDFARKRYDRNYAENTRESVRKYSVKQMVSAGFLLHNPDKPDRAVNSSDNCYQIEVNALLLFRQYGSPNWEGALKKYFENRMKLAEQYARVRELHRVPLKLRDERKIALSPGPHSNLIRSVIEDFGPLFVPGGEVAYIGDTGAKWGYSDAELLSSLGIDVDHHGKMPDVVLYYKEKNWLILVEVVTSSGPVDAGRHAELAFLFKASKAGLVFVTAFPDRGEIFRRFLAAVAWETEVWCASDPTHLIHFNGVRFLGPYSREI